MISFREWLAEKELNESKEYKGSINGTDLYFITNLDIDSDKIAYEKGNYKNENKK
jgi:hypothetical protein